MKTTEEPEKLLDKRVFIEVLFSFVNIFVSVANKTETSQRFLHKFTDIPQEGFHFFKVPIQPKLSKLIIEAAG